MSTPQPAGLTHDEQQILLSLARASIRAAVLGEPLPGNLLADLPPSLFQPAACFVTLLGADTGELRGCTGVLRAQLPLVEEVIRTAAQTALCDPRFPPVSPEELDALRIEISVLTTPQPLEYSSPDEIPERLRPGIDGVTLIHRGLHRATFLPQVWDKIADPIEFLDRLSMKMGLPPGAWRRPGIAVEIYQVQEFGETERAEE